MIPHSELAELTEFKGNGFPVVSFYLNYDRQSDESKHVIRARNLLDRVAHTRAELGGAQAASLDHDLARIRDTIRDQAVSSHHAVAIFAAHGAGLWKAYPFDQRLANYAVVAETPDLRPLWRVQSQQARLATALVEKGKARIFLVTREAIEEVSDVYGDVPGRRVRGGWAQARLQRHHDEHVQRHLKFIAEQLFGLFQDQGFDHLLLSGPHDLLAHLPGLLHPYVRARLAGEMSLPVAASAHDVALATIEALDRLTAEKEASTVQRLLDEAGADNRGVTGLAATLDAVQRGQVATLVISDGTAAKGWYVPELHYYTVRAKDLMLEGQEVQDVDDIVGALMDCAFEHGADVLIVSTAAARAALEPHEGVGALLRFRLEQPAVGPSL